MPYIVALEENLVFETVAEASRALGVDPSNIRKALQGKRQSAGGYHFAAFETKREITKSMRHRKSLTRLKRPANARLSMLYMIGL